MSNLSRVYQIDQILATHAVVSKAELLSRLEVSWATLKRDLAYMRDRFNAPIVFDKELGGYRFDRQIQSHGPDYELPGLWFNADEIFALLTMQHLLSNLDTGGLLGPHIQPLLARLTGILEHGNNTLDEIQKRIKIDTLGARSYALDCFQLIGRALLQRKRLHIDYHARGSNEVTTRTVSPQRLIFYRQNWYLDAWCHLRKGLRSFSVDCIRSATPTEEVAKPVSEKTLNEALGAGYGIFSGTSPATATLRFSAERARWVSAEQWHPQQVSRTLPNGVYELKIPYTDPRELMMDVLRHGSHCEVISPPSLRDLIQQELHKLINLYTINPS